MSRVPSSICPMAPLSPLLSTECSKKRPRSPSSDDLTSNFCSKSDAKPHSSSDSDSNLILGQSVLPNAVSGVQDSGDPNLSTSKRQRVDPQGEHISRKQTANVPHGDGVKPARLSIEARKRRNARNRRREKRRRAEVQASNIRSTTTSILPASRPSTSIPPCPPVNSPYIFYLLSSVVSAISTSRESGWSDHAYVRVFSLLDEAMRQTHFSAGPSSKFSRKAFTAPLVPPSMSPPASCPLSDKKLVEVLTGNRNKTHHRNMAPANTSEVAHQSIKDSSVREVCQTLCDEITDSSPNNKSAREHSSSGSPIATASFTPFKLRDRKEQNLQVMKDSLLRSLPIVDDKGSQENFLNGSVELECKVQSLSQSSPAGKHEQPPSEGFTQNDGAEIKVQKSPNLGFCSSVSKCVKRSRKATSCGDGLFESSTPEKQNSFGSTEPKGKTPSCPISESGSQRSDHLEKKPRQLNKRGNRMSPLGLIKSGGDCSKLPGTQGIENPNSILSPPLSTTPPSVDGSLGSRKLEAGSNILSMGTDQKIEKHVSFSLDGSVGKSKKDKCEVRFQKQFRGQSGMSSVSAILDIARRSGALKSTSDNDPGDNRLNPAEERSSLCPVEHKETGESVGFTIVRQSRKQVNREHKWAINERCTSRSIYVKEAEVSSDEVEPDSHPIHEKDAALSLIKSEDCNENSNISDT